MEQGSPYGTFPPWRVYWVLSLAHAPALAVRLLALAANGGIFRCANQRPWNGNESGTTYQWWSTLGYSSYRRLSFHALFAPNSHPSLRLCSGYCAEGRN